MAHHLPTVGKSGMRPDESLRKTDVIDYARSHLKPLLGG
jgi:hypothetical protein